MNINNAMIATMTRYQEDSPSPIKDAWDETQQAMKCCGIKEWKDWRNINNAYKIGGKVQVPESCCRYDAEGKKMNCAESPNESNAYMSGCLVKSADIVKGHAVLIGGVGIAVSLVMLLGLVLSCLLFKMIT